MLSLLISLALSLTLVAAAAAPRPSAVLPARSYQLQRRDVQGLPLPVAWKEQMLGLNVTIGTPPQNVWLVLETETSEVVVSVNCSDCASQGYADFSPNKSSSLVLGGPAMEGIFSLYPSNKSQTMYDNLTLAGYTVQNQTFYGVPDDSYPNQATVGRIGLGRGAGHSPTPANGTFVRQLASQWDQPVFGVYLRRRSVASGVYLDQHVEPLIDEGVVTFGGLNDSHYSGEVHWMDALGDGWAVQLDGIRVGNQSIDISPLPTANISLPGNGRPIALRVDYTSTTAAFPQPVTDAIYAAANASGNAPQCQAPNITFTLAGRDYTVTGVDVMRYRSQNADPLSSMDDEPPCEGGIGKWNSSSVLPPDMAVLGGLFLQSVYSAYSFDPPRVGLATLKVTEGTLDTTNASLHDHNDTSGAQPIQACTRGWAVGAVAMALGALL